MRRFGDRFARASPTNTFMIEALGLIVMMAFTIAMGFAAHRRCR